MKENRKKTLIQEMDYYYLGMLHQYPFHEGFAISCENKGNLLDYLESIYKKTKAIMEVIENLKKELKQVED